MLQRPTIRYFFIATAVICVCLVIYIQPLSIPTVVDSDAAIPPPTIREVITGILGSWPLRLSAFSIGISTAMHILLTLTAFRGWIKWLIAISVPTFGMIAWYNISVNLLNHHPGSIGSLGILQIGLVIFSIGFAVVSGLFAILDQTKTDAEQKSRTEHSKRMN